MADGNLVGGRGLTSIRLEMGWGPTLDAMSGSSDVKFTDSGIEVRALYTADDLADWDASARLGAPGSPPYTRGVYPTMYRGQLWTMRQ